MKIAITWILIIAVLLGLAYWSKQRTQATVPTKENIETKSVLSVDNPLYDFGTISMKDGKVNKIFEVKNTSSKDLNLESVTTSCMCTNAYLIVDGKQKGPFGMPGHGGPVMKANQIIKAGATQQVEVVYDPNAHGPAGVGTIDRFIFLEDETGGVLQLEIKASVTP